jgi:uncharacterized protein (DUF697 family)
MNEQKIASLEQQDINAKSIMNKYIIGSMGIGLVPIPIFDLVALTGVQLKMLHSISKVYEVKFQEHVVKSLLGSLLGGLFPYSLAPAFASIVKVVPIIGQTTGVLSMTIFAGASTYAVGKIFIQHFASGGTFLDFDPKKMKDYFNELYKKGQKAVIEISKSEAKEAVKEDSQTKDLQLDEAKNEDSQAQDLQLEEAKKEDIQTKDLKLEDSKKEDMQIKDLKLEEVKKEESQSKDIKLDETKKEDSKTATARTSKKR